MRVVVFVFSGLLFACSVQAQYTLAEGVRYISYDLEKIENLWRKVQAQTAIDPAFEAGVDWLPPLFRYEYARQLFIAGRRDEAITQVARAKLARNLDATACKDTGPNSRPAVMVLYTDAIEWKVLNSPKPDKDAWIAAIGQAFEWQRTAPYASPIWLCGKNNSKFGERGDAERSAARELLLTALREDYQRLKDQAKR